MDDPDTIDREPAAPGPPLDRTRFERQYREHYRAIRASIYVLYRDEDVADEVVQKAFVATWEARAGLYDSPALKGYVYKRARFLLLKHLEKAGSSIELPELASECAHPDEAIHREQETERLRRLVARLPPPYRDVVVASGILGLPSKEIADALDISVVAVDLRAFKARKWLRRAWGADRDGPADPDDGVPPADAAWSWLAWLLPVALARRLDAARFDGLIRAAAEDEMVSVEQWLAAVALMREADRRSHLEEVVRTRPHLLLPELPAEGELR